MIPAKFESGFGDGGGDINDNEDGVGDNGNEDVLIGKRLVQLTLQPVGLT